MAWRCGGGRPLLECVGRAPELTRRRRRRDSRRRAQTAQSTPLAAAFGVPPPPPQQRAAAFRPLYDCASAQATAARSRAAHATAAQPAPPRVAAPCRSRPPARSVREASRLRRDGSTPAVRTGGQRRGRRRRRCGRSIVGMIHRVPPPATFGARRPRRCCPRSRRPPARAPARVCASPLRRASSQTPSPFRAAATARRRAVDGLRLAPPRRHRRARRGNPLGVSTRAGPRPATAAQSQSFQSAARWRWWAHRPTTIPTTARMRRRRRRFSIHELNARRSDACVKQAATAAPS